MKPDRVPDVEFAPTTDPELSGILTELSRREPIFHRPEQGGCAQGCMGGFRFRLQKTCSRRLRADVDADARSCTPNPAFDHLAEERPRLADCLPPGNHRAGRLRGRRLVQDFLAPWMF